MTTSTNFIEYGLHWDRLATSFLLAILDLGTMATTSVFFSAIFLDTKKTTIASVAIMFIMFFIGDFSSLMNPNIGETIQYASTWTYYNTGQVFGVGNYSNLPQNIFVLATINVVLAILSLIIFQRKDIPV